MELRTFLSTVLPESGHYFGAYIDKKQQFRTAASVSTIDALLDLTSDLKSKGQDTYFATATFTSGSRKRELVKSKRCFYVDIDCKPGGQYATKQAAIEAIKNAVIAGLLPPTIIVDSGHGWHLYWVVGQDMRLRQWSDYAAALVKACAHFKLKIDAGITTDASRFLRLPTSINYKNRDNPQVCQIKVERDVYTFTELHTGLAPFLTGPTLATPASTSEGVDNSDLSAGLPEGRKASAADMIPRCLVLKDAVDTHGANHQGAMWHKILHLLAYCEDGEQFIHAVSDGHPTYKPEDTLIRFNYSRSHYGSGDKLGPTTCQKFSELSPLCKQCQWWGHIKSPIKLGFGIPSELPWPYRNGERGVEIKADDDEWERVIRYPIRNLKAAVDRGQATFVNFSLGGEHIDTDMAQFVDSRSVQLLLSKYAVTLDPHEIEHLKRLMNAWIEQLRTTSSMTSMVRQLGWVGDDGFHFGGTVFNADGTTMPTFRTDRTLHDIYTPKGALDPWRDCANAVLTQPRPAAWSVLASAFAGPLLGFTGIDGALLSIVGPDSGTGKSTIMRIAQAVWGDPRLAMSSLNDTANSVSNKLGQLHNIPAYWDEVREKNEVTNFVKVIFRLSQGKDKHRLDSKAQQRHVGNWSTMLILASNEPIMDHIARTVANSDAGAARIFELFAEPHSKDGVDDASSRHFFDQVKSNFGHAGMVYAQYLATNRKHVLDTIKATDKSISTKYKTTGDERFWVATIAALLTGARLATTLGLCTFDIPKLTAFLIGEFQRMRIHKAQMFKTGLPLAINALSRYMSAHATHVVRSDILPVKGGKPTTITGNHNAKLPIMVRIAEQENKLRVVLEDFERWCYENIGAGYSFIVQDLEKAGAVRTRGSIDAGMPDALLLRHRCLDIPLTGPLAGLRTLHTPAPLAPEEPAATSS